MDNKRITIKDIFIVLLTLAALSVLVYIYMQDKKEKENKYESLTEISNQITDENQETDGESSKKDKKSELSGLVINEISASGWVELYNSSKNDIQLKNVKLCVNGEEKVSIENEAIDINALVIFDTKTKLGIAEKSDLVTFVDENGNILLSQLVSGLKNGESYGCITEGSVEKNIMVETKGSENSGAKNEHTKSVELSTPSGFYSKDFVVRINAPVDTIVYYTVDGSEPTLDSEKYEDGIKVTNRSGNNYTYVSLSGGYQPTSINMGTVIKAIAVDKKGKIVGSAQETYFVGIENDIGLQQLPVLSIVSDPEGLFGYETGILVAGRKYVESVNIGKTVEYNYTQGWKRNARVSYYEASKGKSFDADMDMKVVRYDSTTDMNQKKILLSGTGEDINNGSSLSRIYNVENNEFTLWTYNLDNQLKIREMLINILAEKTNVGNRTFTPVNVFLNGEYWGLYMLVEPLDKQYFNAQYGIKESNIVVGTYNDNENYYYREFFGEVYNYVTENDMSIEENYDRALSMIDIDSYIDYVAVNFYLCNGHYMTEDAKVWKVSEPDASSKYADGKWRWILGYMDNTSGVAGLDRGTSANTNLFLRPQVREDAFFKSFLKNETFRKKLAKQIQECSTNYFSPEEVSNVMQSISDSYSRGIILSVNRFNGSYDIQSYMAQTEGVMEFYEERPYYAELYVKDIDSLLERYDAIDAPIDQQEVVEDEYTNNIKQNE